MKILICLLLSLAAFGCGPAPSGSGGEGAVKDVGGGSYTAEDSRGKKITFTQKPTRIVSVVVFADEVLLDLVSHDRIAGLDKWVHDEGLSSAVKEAADVKPIIEMNTESIAALKPDLILMPNAYRDDLVATLEDMGFRVYVYKNARRLGEVEEMIRSIAAAVGEKEKGEALIAGFQKDMEAVKRIKKPGGDHKVRALLFLRFGAIGGEGTVYNDALTALGLHDCYNDVRKTSAIAQASSSILTKEEVIQANPDIFLLARWPQGGAYKDSEAQLKEIYEDAAYANVSAVKNRRAYIFPQRYVNCLSHHAGKNLLELAKILDAALTGEPPRPVAAGS